MYDINASNNSEDFKFFFFFLFLINSNSYIGRPLHAVGKRTPRFPVSYLRKKEDGENYVSPKKKRRKSEINANEHSAVLALTEALQRVDSPQMSQTPRRRTENMKSSPVQSWDRMVFYCRLVFHGYCYFCYAIS